MRELSEPGGIEGVVADAIHMGSAIEDELLSFQRHVAFLFECSKGKTKHFCPDPQHSVDWAGILTIDFAYDRQRGSVVWI